MDRRRAAALATASLVGLCAIAAVDARAQSAEDFYRGKRELNLITSSSVGGGYDQYSRLVARHMTKYLPGNPTIIVQNMVGGGGIRAANYIYNVAPKDGTVYCLIDRGMPTAPLLYGEKSKAQFDAVKFSWIGSLMRETGMGVLGGIVVLGIALAVDATGNVYTTGFSASTNADFDPGSGNVTLANNLALYAWHSRHHTAHITRLRERMDW